MFLGQVEVDPTKAREYFDTYGKTLLPEAGLYHEAAQFKSAVAYGQVNELDNRIQAHIAEMDRKVEQLKSMGDPSGPGAMRDQMNVQSQIMFNQSEANRLMAERDQIIGTMEVYGPMGIQLKYRDPEKVREVELISTSELEAPNAAKAFTQTYAQQGASMLLPGAGGLVGQKTMADIARYGAATFTLGLSELVPKFFGGGGKPSGEGVKGWIVDPGKELTASEASQKLVSSGKQDIQTVYSKALNEPILRKVARPTNGVQIPKAGVVDVQQGAIQGKAVYGGMLSGVNDNYPSLLPFFASVAVAWWLMYEVTKK